MRFFSGRSSSRLPPFGVCFALIAATLSGADDEPWRVRVWKEADGLAGNNVRSVVQSADGFLWIVAGGKLTRFDGARLEHFSSGGLPKNVDPAVRLALPLRGGGFALAFVDGALARINGTRTEVQASGLPPGRAETLLEETEGGLLISYDNDIVCRWHDGRLTQLSERDGLPPGSGSNTGDGLPPGASANPVLAMDTRGRIWIGRAGQVGILTAARFEPLATVPDGPMRMVGAQDGGLWITSGLQLFKYQDGTLREVGQVPASNRSARITALLEDHLGAVWIGTTTSGLIRHEKGAFHTVPISHREVVTLMEDRERNVWIGTSAGGLNLVQPRALKIEGAATGLPFQAVQDICEDPNGGLWAVTQDGRFVRRNGGVWEPVLPDWDALGVEATCIAADTAGAIWIGTRNQRILRWHDGRLTTWGKAEGVMSLMIRTLFVSRAGDVWIGGGRPAALQRFRGGQLETLATPAPTNVWALAEDAAGEIWAGGHNGLLLRVTRSGVVVDETPRTGLTQDHIRGLHATADGALWLSYEVSGLGRLKSGAFRLISTADGLADDNLRRVAADGHGWLWLISTRTVSKLRQADLDALAEGRSQRVRPVPYGQDHGLHVVLGGTVGVLLRRDGMLWLPLATSAVIINPALVHAQREAPPVFITALAVDGQVIGAYGGALPPRSGQELSSVAWQLSPDHRRVDVDFTAITFTDPATVRFQHRLEPFDDRWIDSGVDRKATYSRLPAGTYRFQVKAGNSDGGWNETGASLAFAVRPFWWDTWWFRAGLVALFTSAVFGATRYVSFRRLRARMRRLEQENALEHERARIARDIHDDLGSRLTRILMLSRLASRDVGIPEKAATQVHEISEAAQQLKKSLDETVWAVNPRNDDLPNLITYMSHYAVKFLRTAGIACSLDLPEDPPHLHVSAEVRHHVYMAVKEALTNIVRHAGATEVWLHVTVADSALQVRIEDNGVGFKPTPEETEATGNGLRNMAQRMSQIGGEFAIQPRDGGGTRVAFIIPWVRRK